MSSNHFVSIKEKDSINYNDDVSFKQKIMLVDNEPDIVKIFTIVLEKQGYEVKAYTDPNQALHEFEPNYYNLLIIDFKMPQLDGFKLYEKVKQMDSKVKVCFLSGDQAHYKEHQDKMNDLASLCFLHKPIKMNELVKTVRAILES